MVEAYLRSSSSPRYRKQSQTRAVSPALVELLKTNSVDTQKFATGALWHLAMVAEYKTLMSSAGVILPLVEMLSLDESESESVSTLREYAAGVLSALSRTQGGNKKAIVQAGGVKPLVEMLSDPFYTSAASCGMCCGGLRKGRKASTTRRLLKLERSTADCDANAQSRRDKRLAAACLSCCCADDAARLKIVEAGGTEPLLALAHSPMRWLRTQAIEMLHLLGVPFHEPGELTSPRHTPSPRSNSKTTEDGNSKPFIIGSSKMIAQKFLPIRVNKNIEREKENAVVGALEKGDVVYVIERQQLIDPAGASVTRARVALDLGAQPRGWVTMSKDGADFLISDFIYTPETGNQPLSACQKAPGGASDRAADEPAQREGDSADEDEVPLLLLPDTGCDKGQIVDRMRGVEVSVGGVSKVGCMLCERVFYKISPRPSQTQHNPHSHETAHVNSHTPPPAAQAAPPAPR